MSLVTFSSVERDDLVCVGLVVHHELNFFLVFLLAIALLGLSWESVGERGTSLLNGDLSSPKLNASEFESGKGFLLNPGL